jgi:hypothetical protein
MPLYLYRVGTLYHEGRTHWPESFQFNFRENTFELVIFLDKPTLGEQLDIGRGSYEFGIFLFDEVIFFLSKFGRMPWSDSPYSYHLLKPDMKTALPVLYDGQRIILNVVLVDSSNGIIKALRTISLDYEFSVKLVWLIGNQIEQPFSEAAHDASIAEAYRQYPKTSDMLKVAVARLKG